jgi:hypothetical protein
MAPGTVDPLDDGSTELLRALARPERTPRDPGRWRKGVTGLCLVLGVGVLATSLLLLPGSSIAGVVAPVFAGFFFVIGAGAWFLVGWTSRRAPASLRLSEEGLTAVLRDGASVTGRWADPKFSLEVSAFRAPRSGEEVFSLAWKQPSGPLPSVISAAGFEALQAEAAANGFDVRTTEHGTSERRYTTHLIVREPVGAEPTGPPATDASRRSNTS